MRNEPMERRDFLVSLLGLGVATGCASASSALEPWAIASPGRVIAPTRDFAAHGLLAPSPHNRQPWRLRLGAAEQFDLFLDGERINRHTDPLLRQIYIAQGAFIELAVCRASTLGRESRVTYFPSGVPTDGALGGAPIANLRFLPSERVVADALAPWITSRQSNKRPFEKDRIPSSETLRNWAGWSAVSNCDIGWTQDRQKVDAIGRIALEGIRIEATDRERRREIADVFRFSAAERDAHRDGIGVAQSGVTGLKRWIAETFFLSRSDAQASDGSFVKEGFALARKQVESSPVWGWVATEGNSRLEQVIAGRAYARSSLAAAAYGLAQHPMSQALQEYPPADQLRTEVAKVIGLPQGTTVQMLFRLGYAEPVEHTPRRALESILR